MQILVQSKYLTEESTEKKEDPYYISPVQCAICLDKTENSNEPFVELECSVEHKFHKCCLQEWVLIRRAANRAGNCPCCRRIISNNDLGKLFNCIICYDNSKNKKESFISLECSPHHKFHKKCIKKLILHRIEFDIGLTCPYCVHGISQKDIKKILCCRCCCFNGC